jgi:hypothetical protein
MVLRYETAFFLQLKRKKLLFLVATFFERSSKNRCYGFGLTGEKRAEAITPSA